MSIIREQIKNLRDLCESDPEWNADVRALLDAYEERGREIERLRAEYGRGFSDGSVGAFKWQQRAQQAEARLREVDREITECEEFGIERFDPAMMELLKRLRAALAAAQPEEKSK